MFICMILFFFYTRFRLRNQPIMKTIIQILLRVVLVFGGIVSYIMQDYTLGLIMHGLFFCDLILFGTLNTALKKVFFHFMNR
jgi:hypothetical protein